MILARLLKWKEGDIRNLREDSSCLSVEVINPVDRKTNLEREMATAAQATAHSNLHFEAAQIFLAYSAFNK